MFFPLHQVEELNQTYDFVYIEPLSAPLDTR